MACSYEPAFQLFIFLAVYLLPGVSILIQLGLVVEWGPSWIFRYWGGPTSPEQRSLCSCNGSIFYWPPWGLLGSCHVVCVLLTWPLEEKWVIFNGNILKMSTCIIIGCHRNTSEKNRAKLVSNKNNLQIHVPNIFLHASSMAFNVVFTIVINEKQFDFQSGMDFKLLTYSFSEIK